jgi:hypothetical protein
MSLRAAAAAYAGTFAHLLGDNVEARQFLEQGLRLARTAGAPATVAFALHGLAEMTIVLGDRAAARLLLQESLALARDLGDAWATARILSNLTGLARDEGGVELARALAEEGLAIARHGGERRIESTILIHLGSLQGSDLPAAHAYLEVMPSRSSGRLVIGTAPGEPATGWAGLPSMAGTTSAHTSTFARHWQSHAISEYLTDPALIDPPRWLVWPVSRSDSATPSVRWGYSPPTRTLPSPAVCHSRNICRSRADSCWRRLDRLWA